MRIDWPDDWPAEARDALMALVDSEVRVRILFGDRRVVDDPADADEVAGYFYLAGPKPVIVADLSEGLRSQPLPAGPVLRIYRTGPGDPGLVYPQERPSKDKKVGTDGK